MQHAKGKINEADAARVWWCGHPADLRRRASGDVRFFIFHF